jgi:gamma-glutamylcyclotransferase (GGCT)/AIG2-like uncharacterized protein YtfP
MKKDVYQLFVYGSLRSGFKSPAYEYISNYFSLIGEARVKGKLFDMGSYPVGVPMEEETFIIGELYEVRNETEFPWAIAQLDDYEAVVAESNERPLYRREQAEVYLMNRKTLAWVYWFNGDISNSILIPSGDLIEYIQSKK